MSNLLKEQGKCSPQGTKGVHLTPKQRRELEELLIELEYRKKVNPLSFHELMPIQKEFAEALEKIKLLFGGNRSGKTEGVADYVVRKLLSKPKQKIWVVGETYQDSIAIQQSKIWNLIPRRKIKYGYFDDVNGFRNKKLITTDGSIITFKSYDQGREAFQSDDLDLIWDDEEPPIEILREQRMRLLDRDGELVISMTSLKGITDVISDMFDECNVLREEYAPLARKTLPRVAEKNGAKIFFLWTTENKHISQERVVQESALMSESDICSRIYGMPTNLAGRIYPSFNRKIHTCSLDFVIDRKVCLYHILDPHDRKPWAMAWAAITDSNDPEIFIVDEYPERDFNEMLYDDKTYDDYTDVIRKKEHKLKQLFGVPVVKRIIDPNFGNKTMQLAERQGGQSKTTPKEELRKRRFFFDDGIDALEAGHLKVREFLSHLSKDGQVVMQPRLRIVNTCINTLTHHQKYARPAIDLKDEDVKDRIQPLDKYKDFCDLVRYLCMSGCRYIRQQKFVPQTQKLY